MIEYYPVRLEKLDKQKWDELVENRGTVFQLSNWLAVWQRSFPFQSGVYVAVEDGDLIGGLPFCTRVKLNFKEAYSMPRGCYGGAIAGIGAGDDIKKNIESEFAYWCMREDYTRINIIDFSPEVKTNLESFQVRPLSTHILNLKYSTKEQLNNMAESHRRNLPKSFDQGFTLEYVNSDEMVKDYFELLCETAARQKREPYYRIEFYRALREEFSDSSKLRWAAVKLKGRMLASAIIFVHRDMAMYWDGASNDLALENGANFFMFWSVIEKLKEEEIEIFNFGASPKKHPGLKRFKSGWGADRTAYFEYDYQKPLSKIVSKVRGLF